MAPLSIDTSTKEEPFDSAQDRLAYVRERWECMHNCELCGKCHILKGRDAETLYADSLASRKNLKFLLELAVL